MRNPHTYGHDHGCRQTCLVHSGTATIPASCDPQLVRRWIGEVFMIMKKDLAQYDEAVRVAGESLLRERQVLELAIILSNGLLRQSGVAAIDPGRIIRIAPVAGSARGDQFAFQAALPAVDGIPPIVFTNGFDNTVRLIVDHLTGEPDIGRVAPLLDQLLEKAIKPIRQVFVKLGLDIVPTSRIAYESDIPERHLGSGLKRMGWGAKARLMQYSSLQSDAAIASGLCRNKTRTARFLRDMGLPGADHVAVSTLEQAQLAAQRMGWPLVIKPAVAERSQGVTIDVRDEQTLAAAFDEANKFDPTVLVERRVPGFCYRLAICDGQLLFVRAHRPKGLKGDGKLTIRELAEKATAGRKPSPPWLALKPWEIDDLALACMAEDGFEADSVPGEGQFVRFRPIIKDDWGSDFENFTDRAHTDNIAIAIAACRAMGLTLGGVDIISPDITRPWHENGAIINEINYMPQVLRDVPEDRKPIVAAAIVEQGGRIPVHLLTGQGNLEAAALALREELGARGPGCFLALPDRAETPDGQPIPLIDAETLFDRALALLARPDVEELILAGPLSEFAARGFPVDTLAKVHVAAPDAAAAETVWQGIDARVRTGGFAHIAS